LRLEHVHRSRKEPGCISDAVHVDCENLQSLAAAGSTIEIYDAKKMEDL
jgi:quinol monooxygenase YgiN